MNHREIEGVQAKSLSQRPNMDVPGKRAQGSDTQRSQQEKEGNSAGDQLSVSRRVFSQPTCQVTRQQDQENDRGEKIDDKPPSVLDSFPPGLNTSFRGGMVVADGSFRFNAHLEVLLTFLKNRMKPTSEHYKRCARTPVINASVVLPYGGLAQLDGDGHSQ